VNTIVGIIYRKKKIAFDKFWQISILTCAPCWGQTIDNSTTRVILPTTNYIIIHVINLPKYIAVAIVLLGVIVHNPYIYIRHRNRQGHQTAAASWECKCILYTHVYIVSTICSTNGMPNYIIFSETHYRVVVLESQGYRFVYRHLYDADGTFFRVDSSAHKSILRGGYSDK